MAIVNPPETAVPAEKIDGQPPEPQALVFRNEEERTKALSDLSNARMPDGMAVDKWQDEIDRKVQEITTANIGEPPPAAEPPKEGAETPAQPAPATPEQPAETPPAAPAEPAAPSEPPPAAPAAAQGEEIKPPKTLDAAQRAHENNQKFINYLQNERIPQMEREYKTRVSDLEDQVAQLKSAKPASPAAPAQPGATPTEIKVGESKRAEIDQLTAQIDAASDDDKMEPEFLAKLNLRDKLLLAEQDRVEKILQRQNLVIDEIRKSNDEAKAADQRQKEEKQRKDEEDRKQKEIQEGYKEIDSFATAHQDLQMKDATGNVISYEDANSQYEAFGTEVARVLLGRSPANYDEIDAAVTQYLSGNNIALTQACDERGFTPPADLPKFMALTKIHMLAQGFKLDPMSGQWVENQRFGKKAMYPSLESAYHDMKRIDGTYFDELAAAANQGAQATQEAIQKAGNVTPSMPNSGGANPEDAAAPMTVPEASKIISDYTEKMDDIIIAARKNPNDPRFLALNKAMTVLGMKPIAAQ